MNKRLKELARQAKPSPNLIWEKAELERFAELVRDEEREACAALCYAEGKVRLAETIRARGK
jgi:hypothetical protein